MLHSICFADTLTHSIQPIIYRVNTHHTHTHTLTTLACVALNTSCEIHHDFFFLHHIPMQQQQHVFFIVFDFFSCVYMRCKCNVGGCEKLSQKKNGSSIRIWPLAPYIQIKRQWFFAVSIWWCVFAGTLKKTHTGMSFFLRCATLNISRQNWILTIYTYVGIGEFVAPMQPRKSFTK